MFERFTNQSRRVVVLAQEEARMLDHNYIGTEHILLGLLHEGNGSAAQALTSVGVTLEAGRSQVELIIGRGQSTPSGHIPFTPRAKKSLELSLREALQLGHNYIGSGHLLLGLIHQGDNVAVQILGNLHVDLADLRARVTSQMNMHPEQSDEAGAVPARPTRVVPVGPGQTPWVYLRERDLVHGLLDTIDARLSAIEKRLGIARTIPDEVRELDEKIAKIRQGKEAAVDVQDFAQAAALRSTEKELLAERQRIIEQLKAGGTDEPGPAAEAGGAEPAAGAAGAEPGAGAGGAGPAAGIAGTDLTAEADGTAGDSEDPPAAAG